jgi:hypothetical protein
MDVESDSFLRNVQDHLPGDTASHSRILESLVTPLWKTRRFVALDTTLYCVVIGPNSSPVLRPMQWSWQLGAIVIRQIFGRLIGSKSSASCRPQLWTAAYTFFFFFGVSAHFWAVASQIPRFWDVSQRSTPNLDRTVCRTRSEVKWACLCLHRDSRHLKTEDTGRVSSDQQKWLYVWQRHRPFKD